MPAIPINSKPYYNTDDIATSVSSDAVMNCHMEPVPELGFVTRRRPGYRQFCDLGTGKPGDGIFYWDGAGKVIAVSGGKIFELHSDGSFTDITGDPLNEGKTVIFADGQETDGSPWLYMANGKLVYLKGTDTTKAPTDPNAPNADFVAFLKGHFLGNRPGTNKFDVTDTNPDTATKTLSIKVVAGLLPLIQVSPMLTYLPRTYPMATIVGGLFAIGGTAPLVWTGVNLPSGFAVVDLLNGFGEITYTGTIAKGIYYLTAKVTDAVGKVATQTFPFNVVDAPLDLTITSNNQYTVKTGVRYCYPLTSEGGIFEIVWSHGTLPTGVFIDSFHNMEINIPTAGTYAFQVTATDGASTSVAQTITITVEDEVVAPGTTMTVTTTTLPTATIGTPYSANLAASGEIGTFAWNAVNLPPGLTMDESGTITGIPSEVGTWSTAAANPPGEAAAFPVVFTVTDSAVTNLLDNTYWSSVDNPLTCDAKGDALTALFTAWQEAYLWGTQGLEVWQIDVETPLAPVPGAFSEGGLEAPYSVVVADNTIFALCVIGGNRVVVKLQGRAPVVVSDPIGRILADMETVSDAIFDLISVGGLTKLLCNFPTAGQTWCYDYHNDVWDRWSRYNPETAEHEQFIGVHTTFAKTWGKQLMMSRTDGKIYELRRDIYNDDGGILRSYRRTGWLNHGTYNRKRCDQFYVKVKCGDSDSATLLMRFRDDGRAEWSKYIEIPLRPLGNRDFLGKMNRFGIYRSRQYEFVLTDDADMVLVGADAELVGLSS